MPAGTDQTTICHLGCVCVGGWGLGGVEWTLLLVPYIVWYETTEDISSSMCYSYRHRCTHQITLWMILRSLQSKAISLELLHCTSVHFCFPFRALTPAWVTGEVAGGVFLCVSRVSWTTPALKGHKVDELNVSCRESEMSSGRIIVFAVFYILKGKNSHRYNTKRSSIFTYQTYLWWIC